MAATAAGFSVTPQLTLWDNSFVGLANVNFTVNNSAAGSAETLTVLNDQSLSSMTVTGTGDLSIGAYTDTLASLSLTDNSTSTAGLTIAGIADNALTTLALAGSNTATMNLGGVTDTATSLAVTDSDAGNVAFGTLTAANAATESFTNTGAGVLTVSTGAEAVASLTLSGAVVYTATADAVTSGITVSGATDNSTVIFDATGGADATHSDIFTLGNGAGDSITDAGIGNISVTLGTGARDGVSLGAGSADLYPDYHPGQCSYRCDSITSTSIGTVHITVGTGANTIVTAGGATVTESLGAHALNVADRIRSVQQARAPRRLLRSPA